jgi:outer membrane immunogenic protein
MKKLFLAAIAALTFSTAARAADWSGFYLGVLGGASFSNLPDCGPSCDATVPGIAKVVGYNWDTGDVIFGIDELVAVSFWPYNDENNVQKLQWQAMARVGIEITDNVMIYGAAGGGIAFVWSEPPPPENSLWYAAVAAGVEVALSEELSWRTHLQYSRSEFFTDCSGCFIQATSVATGVVWTFN